MAHKQTRHRSHPDFRHRSQLPLPAVDDVEQRLLDVLSPSLLAPRQLERRDPRQPQRLIRMRQRLLTLPVMVAIIVSLVWRRVPSIAEVQKVLSREGLLGMAPLRVSPQAITKRLDVLPAAVMGQLFTEVCTRMQAHPPPLLYPRWAPGREHFPLLAIVDGSTLEALRKKTQLLRQREGLVLAGKIMVMVEAFSHRPLGQLYTEEAAANDKRFAAEILAVLPVGGLVVLALGFFSFLWFDDFKDQHKCFVTRMREKDCVSHRAGTERKPVLLRRAHPGGPVPRESLHASTAPGVGPVAGRVVSLSDQCPRSAEAVGPPGL